jgi:hypothetical protein
LTVTFVLVWIPCSQARSDVYYQLLRSTGWVVVKHGKKKFSSGTCWVLDERRCLVVTNQHVVGTRKKVKVFFPRYRKGKVIRPSRSYVQKKHSIPGKVLATDGKRDLALIRLKRLPPGIGALALATDRPAADEPLYSVGNSSVKSNVQTGKLWRFVGSKVKQLVFGKFEQKTKLTVEACVLKTFSRFGHGDSGGPLVNARNQLVAVVDAISTKNRRIGFSIDVTEVREFVEHALPDHPRPPGARVLVGGSWKAVFGEKGKEAMFRVTFRGDGTLEMIGVKILPGRYTYVNGVLGLQVSSANLRGSLTWDADDRFTVTLGKDKMRFHRR